MEISKQERLEIINQKIKMINASIYDCSLDIRVAKNCSDENMEKPSLTRMKKLEAMKDEYLKAKAEEEQAKD